MPTRDPFADKRKISNGCRPKQAKLQEARKKARNYKRKTKVEKDLEKATRALSTTERKLEIKQHMLALMADAPSPAQQRKIIMATFNEAGFNPIQEMIEIIKDPDSELSQKDRASIINNLASYFAPKPKTIDLQANMQSDVTITVMDYSKATKADFETPTPTDPTYGIINVTDSEEDEYAEFLAPEDQ